MPRPRQMPLTFTPPVDQPIEKPVRYACGHVRLTNLAHIMGDYMRQNLDCPECRDRARRARIGLPMEQVH